MPIDAIILNEADNVATAVQALKAGQEAVVRCNRTLRRILINEDIEYGHKFSVRDVSNGEDIVKYGEVIGRAIADIQAGCHAHVQNVESLRGRGDLRKGA